MPRDHSNSTSSEDEDFHGDKATQNFKIINGISTEFSLNPLRADSALLTYEELNSPDNEIWIVTAPKTVYIVPR